MGTHAVIVHLSGWLLCIPQEQVVSVELLNDAICTRKGSELHWSIGWKDQKIPLYAYNSDAEPMEVESSQGNSVVLIGSSFPVFGLVCDGIDVIDNTLLKDHSALPAVMSSGAVLFDGLGRYEEQLVCLSNAQKMQQHLLARDEGHE